MSINLSPLVEAIRGLIQQVFNNIPLGLSVIGVPAALTIGLMLAVKLARIISASFDAPISFGTVMSSDESFAMPVSFGTETTTDDIAFEFDTPTVDFSGDGYGSGFTLEEFAAENDRFKKEFDYDVAQVKKSLQAEDYGAASAAEEEAYYKRQKRRESQFEKRFKATQHRKSKGG